MRLFTVLRGQFILILAFLITPQLALPQTEELLKVVPVRFCIVDTNDKGPMNERLNINTLINALRQKNEIWAQCKVV